MTIGNDWQRCSAGPGDGKIDFQATSEDMSKVPGVGARERQKVGYDFLKAREGKIDLRAMADLLRQHHDGYDPAEGEICTNICMHGGPFPTRFWQACGAMISEATPQGAMAWVTATSGTCVSIFKPVYFGVPGPTSGRYRRRPVPKVHSGGSTRRCTAAPWAISTGWPRISARASRRWKPAGSPKAAS